MKLKEQKTADEKASKPVMAFLLMFVLILVCTSFREHESKHADKPNVVFILVDQWRSSALGYAGDPNVITPHLDAFASKAVNFPNAVSVCPVCTPYRASLMTGRYPTSTGMFLNDLYLPEEELCLAEVFKNNGYNTAYIGKWHLDGHGRHQYTPRERRQGFDYWMGLECSHDYNEMPYYDNDSPEMKTWDGYSPFALSKESQNYISQQATNDTPFFLFLSLASPHFPHHTAPEEYQAMYPEEDIKINPNVPGELHDHVKKELKGYYAHCTATDMAIGDLLDKLKELELMNNTIVVFTSDHGEIMGAHGIRATQKQVPFIESAGVPFLIHTPGKDEKSGRKINVPITTPDISATLLRLANIDVPESFEGEDFSDIILTGEEVTDRAALYMSVSSFARVQAEYKREYRAIKTNQYSYVKGIEGAWFLFNDLNDPYQMNNLVDNPEFADIQKQLDKQLMQELAKIGDDFRPAGSYISQWRYQIEKNGHILYDLMGEVKVQSPNNEK
jgi:arylsulfatase A-like enzyme